MMSTPPSSSSSSLAPSGKPCVLNPAAPAFACRLPSRGAEAAFATPQTRPRPPREVDGTTPAACPPTASRGGARAPVVDATPSTAARGRSASPATADFEVATPNCAAPNVIAPARGAVSCAPLWCVWEWWGEFAATGTPQKSVDRLGARQQQQQEEEAPSTSWLDRVRSVGVFDTVEGFWGLHGCLVEPSALPMGGNHYVFRSRIAPMWEHECNRRGGRWVLALPLATTSTSNTVTATPLAEARGGGHGMKRHPCDECWLALLVALVGEQLPGDETEVCGVAASRRRRAVKIALWTRNADDEAAQAAIGAFLRKLFAPFLPASSGAEEPPLQFVRHLPSPAGAAV